MTSKDLIEGTTIMENYYLGNVKRWSYINKNKENCIINKSKNNVPAAITKLLNQRGINSQSEIDIFLNPSIDNLHDPFLLNGMMAAVDRILFAIENNENILIYGDYDADGVSATAILIKYFRTLNINVDFYIPDRIDEGYGISDQAVEFIINQDYDLVITVDCGISGKPQIDTIYEKCSQRDKRVDFIITDHHQCNEDLIPNAIAVINPHLPDSEYPFKNLCGAGVALKLIQALCISLNKPKEFEEYLDIVAIATIADIVELQGENRIITKIGMAKIKENPCIGIKALLDVSLTNSNQMDSYRLSFILAPRINAAGRMGNASIAVKLFTTDDESEAKKLATLLNNSNIQRQEVQDEIFKEANRIIENEAQYQKEKVLVVHSEGWHHGVIGIVASKIVDRYHKPAFVLSAENGKAVGSARSIEGFNLFKAMEAQADLLIKYGGHEQAGGLTVSTENLDLFRKQINIYADNLITEEMLIPETAIDLDVTGADINLETAKIISCMEPFGAGNRTPVFCYKGAVLNEKKAIGNGKHLRLVFTIEGKNIDGVFFGKGTLEPYIFINDKMDIVFTQEVNDFRGNESLQIRLLDMRLTEPILEKNRFLVKAARGIECLDCDVNWLYNGIIDKIIINDDIIVNRDILAGIYKYIIQKKAITLSIYELFVHAKTLDNETKKNINIFKLLVALLIFDELGLMEVILEANGSYRINPPQEVVKVNLEDSEILEWINTALHSLG